MNSFRRFILFWPHPPPRTIPGRHDADIPNSPHHFIRRHRQEELSILNRDIIDLISGKTISLSGLEQRLKHISSYLGKQDMSKAEEAALRAKLKPPAAKIRS